MAIQYVLLIIQTIIMMVILFGIFDNPLEGSIPLCSVLLFLVGTAGTAFGLLLAMICDSFSSATFAALGSYFPLFLFSGMIWPMEGMHYVLRTIGYVLPLTLSIESFRAMTTKAWSIDNPTVYVGFLSSFSWTLILTVITLLAVKLSRDLRLSF
ncbi:hypothetical protein AAG570_012289 [Ranatra chinensis]|uniref:ABC-2 type transporter transmembrane domain-containing protein n=1 Tax=Ranatra chinensis TaxID=642074 RepID=A0ABD0YUQ8_9HEMI